MKPPPFEYFAPATLDEGLELIERYADTGKLLAGGQSLVPLMNLRLAYPEQLIDLNRVTGLDAIHEADGGVAIGAMARQRAAERSEIVRRRVPLLAYALRFVGHPQIRNRGTVGGSLAHADPGGEIGLALLALGGHVTVRSRALGERRIAADDLFESFFTTTLRPEEVLTEAWFPLLSSGSGWGFREVARRGGDFALVSVAATVRLDGRRIAQARIAIGGVAAAPIRAQTAEQAACEGASEDEAIAAAVDAARRELEPNSDVHASSEYRRVVVGVLTGRALRDALVHARED